MKDAFFARMSVINQKTADIELVVRKEDSTSNRRLSSLNLNLSLSLSLPLSPSLGEDTETSQALAGETGQLRGTQETNVCESTMNSKKFYSETNYN